MPTWTFISQYEVLGIKANEFAEMLTEGKAGEEKKAQPSAHQPPPLPRRPLDISK